MTKFNDLDRPIFNISNRNWWVKVLGMLCHNWALIESGYGGAVEIYFFQDTAYGERPKIVDSLSFHNLSSAIAALKRNGFEELSQYPGPWVGAEPQGEIWDGRASGPRIYSEGGYWLEEG
jgi:hypothetical protein